MLHGVPSFDGERVEFAGASCERGRVSLIGSNLSGGTVLVLPDRHEAPAPCVVCEGRFQGDRQNRQPPS